MRRRCSCLPVVTGSHVGPFRSHTSGRILTMPFRAWVAAQRHMGFEMDLRELTPEAEATLTAVTAWWKANRDWMHRRRHPAAGCRRPRRDRRDAGRPAMAAASWCSPDRPQASDQILPRPLRLTGLEPDATYRMSLKNPEDAPQQSRGPVALKQAH